MNIIAPYKGKFRISQEYKGSKHQGLDLVGITSKNLYSTVNGTVEIASNADPNGFGLYVRIKADDTGWLYYYGHMSSVCVNVGQHVEAGTKIGVEGSTGKSTGSHCHYEVRKIPGKKNSFADINEISGIPNKIGEYESNLSKNSVNITENNSISTTDPTNIIYRVQVGAYSIRDNAEYCKTKLAKNGFKDSYISTSIVNGRTIYRVQIGAFSVKENADNYLKKVKDAGYTDAFIMIYKK